MRKLLKFLDDWLPWPYPSDVAPIVLTRYRDDPFPEAPQPPNWLARKVMEVAAAEQKSRAREAKKIQLPYVRPEGKTFLKLRICCPTLASEEVYATTFGADKHAIIGIER